MRPQRALRMLIASTLLAAKLFAFIPFSINLRTFEIERSCHYAVYALIHLTAFLVGIVCSSTHFMSEVQQYNSEAVNTLLLLYSFMYFAACALGYIEHYAKMQQFEQIFHEFASVFRTVDRLEMRAYRSYGWLMVWFAVQTFILPACDACTFVVRMNDIDKRHNGPWTQYTQHVLLTVPNLTISIMTNHFCGSVLVLYLLYREINGKLRQAMRTTRRMEAVAVAGRRHFWIGQQFCDLSDTVDAIAALHFRLSQLARRLNGLVMISLSLWVAYKTMGVLVYTFSIYICLVDWIILAKMRYSAQFLYTFLIGLAISVVELMLLSSACVLAMDESQKAADIVKEYHSTLEMDVRCCRSIDQLCLQIRQNKVNFNSWGMYTIDFTLIYSIVTTTITYLVIMIQFEMS